MITPPIIHATSEIEAGAVLGSNVVVWNWSKVRTGAAIGEDTVLGQGVFVDHDVVIGKRCKIMNGVSIFFGVTVGDDVFVGPNACFTNDKNPRAYGDWEMVPTRVEDRVSIGANATIVCGVTLGRGSMIGAGAVVASAVPPYGLAIGQPARVVDFVDDAGVPLRIGPDGR